MRFAGSAVICIEFFNSVIAEMHSRCNGNVRTIVPVIVIKRSSNAALQTHSPSYMNYSIFQICNRDWLIDQALFAGLSCTYKKIFKFLLRSWIIDHSGNILGCRSVYQSVTNMQYVYNTLVILYRYVNKEKNDCEYIFTFALWSLKNNELIFSFYICTWHNINMYKYNIKCFTFIIFLLKTEWNK